MTPLLHDVTKVTRRQDLAARLTAENELADEAIAQRCRISRQTLVRWKHLEAFAARVAEHREAWRQAILQEGIADKVQRVRVLADLDERLRRVIRERAADPTMADVPGGQTGLLTRRLQSVRVPDRVEERDGVKVTIKGGLTKVWENRVDTATVSELRGVHEQVSKELGQWVEKREIAHTDFLRITTEMGKAVEVAMQRLVDRLVTQLQVEADRAAALIAETSDAIEVEWVRIAQTERGQTAIA